MINFSILIPVRNGGEVWKKCASSIVAQTYKPLEVIVIDSASSDGTLDIAKEHSFNCFVISPDEFSHGGTRNELARLALNSDVFVFMTQDAIFQDENSLKVIIELFENNPRVSAICGRQLPHSDANPLAMHARYFNYPDKSEFRSYKDISEFGLKVAFMSNSFAAYRREVFESLGGFTNKTILAEDMYMAAKMILSGYEVAYCAEAKVMHSHNYTPWDEFRRYFDTGVFHASEPWIQEQLGGASGEGLRFVKSELLYLCANAPLWIPRAILTTACKLIGYKLGKNYKSLPRSLRPKLSMYKSYWLQHKNNK